MENIEEIDIYTPSSYTVSQRVGTVADMRQKGYWVAKNEISDGEDPKIETPEEYLSAILGSGWGDQAKGSSLLIPSCFEGAKFLNYCLH